MIDFESLYLGHATEVHRYAYFLSGNQTVAEDIVSETFIRVWGARERIELPTVRAYLLAIARNLYLQGKRRTDRETELPETLVDAAQTSEERKLQAYELEETLRDLQALPESDRSAVLLRAEGVSYGEVGTMLHISPETARVRVFRARGRLAKARAARTKETTDGRDRTTGQRILSATKEETKT